MASLADVYGDDFAKKMATKNYDYLKKLKPSKPLPTTKGINKAKKINEIFDELMTKTFDFGNNIKINKLCFSTFPCQHICNGELLSASFILKNLENSGIIDENGNLLSGNNLTSEQEQFIMHLAGQVNYLKKQAKEKNN